MLVTGGLGTLGARVAAALEARGAGVVTADLAAPASPTGREHRVLDVRDAAAVSALLADLDVDRVVHLAARVHDGRINPRPALDVNVGGTLNVIEAVASRGGGRVVMASSRTVYGEITPPGERFSAPTIDEDQPRRPTNVYGVGKLAAETFGTALAARLGVEFACLRFGSIFGPGPPASAAGDRLREVCEAPLADRPVRVDRGDQRDDFVYIEDAAAGAALAALAAGPDSSGPFHISSGRATTLRELAAVVRALVPATDLEVGPGLDPFELGHDCYAVLDHSRATAAFGYWPRYDLRAALVSYLAAQRTEPV